MKNTRNVSSLTQNNWILDATLFLGALVASLSGIYFLIFPDGGYKGGRNPYYGIQIIFDRAGWEWIHTWISLGMIAVALIHLLFHWKWVLNTTRRVIRGILERKITMNKKSWLNTLLNGVVAVGFLLSAISGIYFLLTPDSQGGQNADPMFLFSRIVWDNLHTWSSIAFISAAIIHLTIHWGWVTKVTCKIFTRSTVCNLEQSTFKAN
ncbi:MAG: DUF4405 domain-containing protein [Chloroflexi bacterium]|nr:DUF4405 domain-containing protein [Chloroflexota bacterium]